MPTFVYQLIVNPQNEHESEHDFPVKKHFSNPKIYTANGDLKKRWYVYFSFRNPDSGKLSRMKNIYGISNKYKTKEERLSILTVYRRNLLKLLKEGFDPFADNTQLLEKRKSKTDLESDVAQNNSGKNKLVEAQIPVMKITEAFDFALSVKKRVVNERTYKSYSGRVKNFINWLNENSPDVKTIDNLSKTIVLAFLNTILQNTSARTRNNIRVDLGSLFQTLEDNEIVELNFIKKISVLKSIPERNKTYSDEKQQEIYLYLEKKDPLLLLYIKFISYNFLRPIEVCRLKIRDIDLKNKRIQFKAKNKALKTKIIPDLLISEIPDLTGIDPDCYLFTPDGIGKQWSTSVDNKRNYFSKRFNTNGLKLIGT